MGEKCPGCGSKKLSRDYERGELVCNGCGLVVAENILDSGPEWRAFDAEQREKRVRGGAPIRYMRPNKGLVTEIDQYNRDIRGAKISSKKQAQLYRMRKWHKRASIASSMERNLAIALNEIPRGKLFFRTVFYLPAMTSSILIAFVWREFYDKTEKGLLNSLLAPVIEHGVNPVWHGWFHGAEVPLANDWLGNPTLAMFAVVLPGIWAGAGPGSILYLAALKNISEERYEAADLDGANWWQKIVHITLPGLKPLILINLLGVFIASFKASENILVMTGGGPLNSTRTIGLEVWQNAFMYLKFGYATAAAWVMGAILIGFTLIQIKNLTKMKFTAAKL